MAGGIWGKLSNEEKRELFRASFVDQTVAPEKRDAALKGEVPPPPPPFPDLETWQLQNRNLLSGMTPAEVKKLYGAAYTKAFKKARGAA